ncbi:MAG: hypothetical protein ACJBCI_02350 [Candidatus Tisiphia sp.]|jgi:hypothetical protein|uniref:hypothetical protein n=1 Tax=Candidatus Tisiphia endosymbiont of Melanophora roralis TaxID=3066261 RepID=UPI001E6AF642|nr:MAG: hypothetical protein LF884_05000 [Rickettsia endosymbiont of Cimex lectularius]
MEEDLNFSVEEVKWSEVKDEVYKVNPELAEKCDNVNQCGKYSLFKIKYPYGAYIVNRGEFHLPTKDGKLISINDSRIPEFLKKKLRYSHIPLSLILNSLSEVFVQIQNRIVSLNVLLTGELFGLFELMHMLNQTSSLDMPIWNVSAGARSTVMIPSISDTVGHNRIKKKLGVDIHAPYSLSDHWQTFVDINKYSHNSNWNNSILVFSNEWFLQPNDLGYSGFYNYLVNQCWKQFQLLEDFTDFSLLWSFFIHAINLRNLKPRSYLIDTVRL